MDPHGICERAFEEIVISNSGLGKDVGKCMFLRGCQASDRWDMASVWKDCKDAQRSVVKSRDYSRRISNGHVAHQGTTATQWLFLITTRSDKAIST